MTRSRFKIEFTDSDRESEVWPETMQTLSVAGRLHCYNQDGCSCEPIDSKVGKLHTRVTHLVEYQPHYYCKDTSGERCRSGKAECLTSSRFALTCAEGAETIRAFESDIISFNEVTAKRIGRPPR